MSRDCWGGETLTTGHYSTICASPLNTKRIPNVVLMLDQRRRRWSNIKSTLARCILFTVRDTDGCWAADNCAFWRSPFWEAHGDCPPPPPASSYQCTISKSFLMLATLSQLVTWSQVMLQLSSYHGICRIDIIILGPLRCHESIINCYHIFVIITIMIVMMYVYLIIRNIGYQVTY